MTKREKVLFQPFPVKQEVLCLFICVCFHVRLPIFLPDGSQFEEIFFCLYRHAPKVISYGLENLQ